MRKDRIESLNVLVADFNVKYLNIEYDEIFEAVESLTMRFLSLRFPKVPHDLRQGCLLILLVTWDPEKPLKSGTPFLRYLLTCVLM